MLRMVLRRWRRGIAIKKQRVQRVRRELEKRDIVSCAVLLLLLWKADNAIIR